MILCHFIHWKIKKMSRDKSEVFLKLNLNFPLFCYYVREVNIVKNHFFMIAFESFLVQFNLNN